MAERRFRLKNLVVSKVALVPAGANPGAHVVLYKSEEPPADPSPEHKEEPVKKALKDMTHEELLAHAEELEKAQPPQPDPEPEIPAAVQKILDSQAEELRKATERLAAAEATAKAETEKRERTEMASVAKSLIPNLPGTDVIKGNVLFTLQKGLSKEDYESVLGLLKAGNEAMVKVLDSTKGSDEDGTADKSAVEQLDMLAKEMVKEGKAPTYAQAFTKAAEMNPDLYKQYREERRIRVN